MPCYTSPILFNAVGSAQPRARIFLVVRPHPFHFRPMNFPPFWARGQTGDFICWRWSSTSVAEAQSLADEAAQKLADRIRVGDRPPKRGGYYPNRPFREPVLQEIKDHGGKTAAVITRNSYGCLVLNTAN